MKTKHIIIATAVIFIITVILLFYLHSTNEKEVVQRFQAEQLFASRQLAREIESYLRNRSRGVEVLSTFKTLQKRDMKEIAATIKEYFEYLKKDHVKAISVYDEKGTIIYSTAEGVLGSNYAKSDFFQWAAKKENKDKQFISSLVGVTGKQIEHIPNFRFLIAAPIYQEVKDTRDQKPTLKFVGIVTSTIDLEEVISHFLPFVSAYAHKEHAYILDRNGTVLFHSEHPEMALRNIRLQDKTCFQCHVTFEHVETILNERQGTTEYQLKDKPKKLASYSSIEFKNISWKIVISIPYEEVYGFINRNLYMTLILIGIITLTLIGGSSLIYRSNRLKIRVQEEAKQWREKHELEDKIRESEKRYRTMIETAHDIVWTLDTQGNFTFINSIGEKITGHKFSDWIGKSFVPLILSEDLPKVQEVFLRTLKGTPQSYDVRIYDIKGKIVVLSVNTVPIYQDDIVVGTVSFGRDITERKRAEEELHRKDEHHKALIENIFKFVPEGVLVLTESLNLLKHNKAFDNIVQKYAPLLGYTEEELAEKITDQLRSKIVSGDSKEIHIGKKDQLETDISGRDELLLQFNTARMFLAEEEEEEEARIVVSLLDITERKRAEEGLHRKEEHHKAVIENIFKFVPEGVLVLTESLNLLKHNKAFDNIVQKYAPLLGYTEEELAEKITEQLRSKIATGDAAEIRITKKNQFRG